MEIPFEIASHDKVKMVSLITDFGNKDYYVGSLKAKLYNTPNQITVIDVSHEIDTHDIVKASFFIQNYYQDFPIESIHVAAVNNAYDYEPELLCFQYNGHYFIGPNNGLFSLVFTDIDEGTVRHIVSDGDSDWKLVDKIAYAVHHILEHGHINNLGLELKDFDQKLGIQPVFSKNEIRASVIHVDHYENVIVNLRNDAFEECRNSRNFRIFIKPTDPIEQISDSYAEVPVGEALCLFNDMGYLTIAINMGKASSMYSLERNDTIQILFY